jgi:hypothetical protein
MLVGGGDRDLTVAAQPILILETEYPAILPQMMPAR